MTKHSAVFIGLALLVPAATFAAAPRVPSRAPTKAGNKALFDVKRRLADTRVSPISLAKAVTLSPAHAAPVPWAHLGFQDPAYVVGKGYGGTGYASFYPGEGYAKVVIDTPSTQARLVSCGVYVFEGKQTFTVRNVADGDLIANSPMVYNTSHKPGPAQINFVALGSAETHRYPIKSTGAYNLLYCDVFSYN